MQAKKLSFAVIGGGPAGFYIAKQLLKLKGEPIVHILEKQLCPFGLLRYGVAPDHITIKKSEIVLSKVAQQPNFSFIGNKPIQNKDLAEVARQYSGIVYAYGAQGNKIASWMKGDIFTARQIVEWYNSHPSKQGWRLNLKGVQHVALIGNGNVAIDIGRILLRNPQDFLKTQMSEHVIEQLVQSDVRTVSLIARRGITHSAFALKEVRELHSLGIQLYAIEEQLQNSLNEQSVMQCTALGHHHSHLVRVNKRKTDFIRDKFKIIKKSALPSIMELPSKKIIFRYLLSPESVNQHNLSLRVTSLHGEPFSQVSEDTEQRQDIHFDLLISSTGFKVGSFDSDEYDTEHNQVRNSNGCVIANERVNIGRYAVGWCRNGAKGVLDETLLSCQETYNNIRIHVENNLLLSKRPPEIDLRATTNFKQYEELRTMELARGDAEEFIRKKLSYVDLKAFFDSH